MRTPLTYILLVVNIAVFGLQWVLGLDDHSLVYDYG